jgi:hypothetical protein
MANDAQTGGRTFLAVVLGGIVLALILAAYVMYGSREESAVRVKQQAITQPAPVAPSTVEKTAPTTAPTAPAVPPAAVTAAPLDKAPAAPATPPADNQ